MPATAPIEPPPFPDKRIILRPMLITMGACFALVGFAAHMHGTGALAFCAIYAAITVWLMFQFSVGVRKQVLPRVRFRLDPPWRRSAVMLGLALVFAILLNVLDRYVFAGFYLHNLWLNADNLERFLDASLLVRICAVIAVNGFFSAQLSYERLERSLVTQAEATRAAEEARRQLDAAEILRQKAEVEARTATQLATEAELTALKMQINPHFLFNTLGSIAVLARIDGPRAGEMTEKLAEMFRYALQASKRPGTTLGEELDFLKAYFEIEKSRFGARLEMSVDVPAALRSLPVPNLLLQPIVENAVVHAFKETCTGWRIAVRASVVDSCAEISVADNGRGFGGIDPYLSIGRGTALKNIDERLRRFYGQDTRLIVAENSPRGALFTVRVPLNAGFKS